MVNSLTRKLQRYAHLSDADQLWLAEALGSGHAVAARSDIVHHDDHPRAVNVILEGWACRYRLLADGRRQIVALMLPGDLCDPHVFLLDRMDHAISAITPLVLAQIPGAALEALTARSPSLAYAFHREALATVAIQREWAVSLGRRSGIERLAHLFCELYARLDAVGLAEGSSCPLPLPQTDLGDALGQTSVHINRTLKELRGMGMVSLQNRCLTIHDRDGLARLGQFDPIYLHFMEEADRR